MDDRAAFLQAILASPDDDTPRLVFADWLDEQDEQDDRVPWDCKNRCGVRHDDRCSLIGGPGSVPAGNATRAEFIRVQVELAKHGSPRRVIDGPEFPIKRGDRYWEVGTDSRYLGLRVGDRVDIIEPSRMNGKKKRKPLLGLRVNKFLDGEDGPESRIILVEDAESGPDTSVTLRTRSSDLLAAHGTHWLKALGITPTGQDGNRFAGYLTPGGPVVYDVRFGRGFVEAVTVPTSAEFVGDRDCPRLGARSDQNHRRCDLCSGLGRVRACPGCDGRGWLYADGTKRVPCVACGGVDAHLRDGKNGRVFVPAKHGEGWVVPLAPALARVPGIATVEIGDRVPDEIGDEFCWLRDREGLADNLVVLPDPIFDRLEGGRKEDAGPGWVERFGHEDEWVVYPTRDAAVTALSLACGGLLRSL